MDQLLDWLTGPTLLVLLTGLSGVFSLLFVDRSATRSYVRSAKELRERLNGITEERKQLEAAYSSALATSVPTEHRDSEGESTAKDPRPLSDTPPNPAEFLAFWESTHKRIEQYHHDARGQLRSSYRLAQLAAVLGFVVMIAMGITAAFTDTTAQSVTVGAIGALAGALSAYIAKTFNDTYRRASAQTQTFFHEPVVMARLLAAERLLGEYSNEDDEARARALEIMIGAAVQFDVRRTAPAAEPDDPKGD